MRKYSAIFSNSFGVEIEISHITRKNAIMAMAKSASAIGLVLAVPLTTGIAALTVPGRASLPE